MINARNYRRVLIGHKFVFCEVCVVCALTTYGSY